METKLRQAIKSDKCESTSEKVKKDNNYSFGKWLHEIASNPYQKIPK